MPYIALDLFFFLNPCQNEQIGNFGKTKNTSYFPKHNHLEIPLVGTLLFFLFLGCLQVDTQ